MSIAKHSQHGEGAETVYASMSIGLSIVEEAFRAITTLQLSWKWHQNSSSQSFFMADERFPYNLGMSLLPPLDPGMGSIFLAAARFHGWLALIL